MRESDAASISGDRHQRRERVIARHRSHCPNLSAPEETFEAIQDFV